MDETGSTLIFQGFLEGHNDWVTSIVSGNSKKDNEDHPLLISGSRDKSLIIWKLKPEEKSSESDPKRLYGYPFKALTGHNHFVSDIALSNENVYALSSSWDKTIRLWDLRTGKTVRLFKGHTKEVFSVAFSPDDRQVLSGGAEKNFRLWNTMAECKLDEHKNDHLDWVSSIRYAGGSKANYFATSGFDGRLKVWNPTFTIKASIKAHDCINALSISPGGAFIATGGKDCQVKVWDPKNLKEPIKEVPTGGIVNAIAFNPRLRWIAVGTENGIKLYDLSSEIDKSFCDITAEQFQVSTKESAKTKKIKPPSCTSLTWSSTGQKLFAGFTDKLIRVYHVEKIK